MEITDQNVADFKARMHITHKAEDLYLKQLLEQSAAYVCDIAGLTELNDPATELVFERARYAYNDKLSDFDNDFQSPMLNLSLASHTFEEVDWNGTAN